MQSTYHHLLYGLLVIIILTGAMTAQALQIGDKAPPLEVTWLQGEAVNPGRPDGKTVYIIEFWATWCGPCRITIPELNKLYEKYKDRNVVITGITMENAAKARPFMQKMDMQYRVAVDPDRSTADTYMKGVRGIPHAFIVDTNGVIVWSGHPQSHMEAALEGILNGSYDPEKHKKIAALESTLQQNLQRENLDAALANLDELIDLDPENRFGYYSFKASLFTAMDQPEKLPALYKEMLSRATTDEDFNTVAWMAVEAPMPHRDLQVAHEAIQQALDKMQRSDAAILDTAARVYYLLGFLDRAVEYAQQAAHAEIASKEEKKSMQVMLAFYKEALSMHERIKNAAASSADTGSADTE